MIKKTKKNLSQLNKGRVAEELGDLLWYMNITLDELGLSFEDIIQNNLSKIDARYPKENMELDKLIRGEE